MKRTKIKQIFTLCYAPLKLNGSNINYEEITTFKKLVNRLKNIVINNMLKDIVYLINYQDETLVTDWGGIAVDFLEKNYGLLIHKECEDCNIYLQEYKSYEEAYKVALEMKETNPLCYEKD